MMRKDNGKKNSIYILPKSKCTGCLSCFVVCARGAISAEYNMEGYVYPKIEINKCVNCGKCMEYCPALIVDSDNEIYEKKYYIGNSKKIEMLQKSASGAIFAELANIALNKQYYVSGAIYDENYRGVHHIVSRKLDDINKMKGSKYCKSKSFLVYQEILTLVKAGNKVVFSGVGCECAAVKKICEKYLNNLILIQIICKGALSSVVLDKYLNWYEQQENESITYFTMRHKEGSAIPAYEYVNIGQNEKIIKNQYYMTVHGKLYASNALLRKSCYQCSYRSKGLIGDIILGDAPTHLDIPNADMGCSTIVINSKKGKNFIDNLDINIIQVEEKYAKSYCKRLIYSPHKPVFIGRKRLFQYLNDKDSTKELVEKKLYNKRYLIKLQQKIWKLLDDQVF